ncbi:MAG TPA: hypothetical protein VFU15_12565, partial [Bacteroidia bacterium]|nr:hypothetical protein [Bacteroidia bacterium]
MNNRKLLLLFALLSLLVLKGFAQAPPQGINYQAVARNASGAELTNTTLSVRISIYSDAAATQLVFQE